MPRAIPRWLPLATAALGVAALFVALNYRAYDGYFQDDELDNLTWAPRLTAKIYLSAFASPLFDKDNFRPAGALYFTLMGAHSGLDYPPWITPIFAVHLLNGLLLFLLMRRLNIRPWHALAGSAVFILSASAFDAYWKPMYIFDLLCTTFSLAAILLYAQGRWIVSLAAFWLAYKAKELAVMLPLVLAAWEFWFGREPGRKPGRRRFRILIPFFLISLSFGIQGLLLNPNKDNDYTIRLSFAALRHTIPFYSLHLLMFPFSGMILLALAATRDRRVWFGLAALIAVTSTLLFLPGRLFEAYVYLPFAFAVIALTAAASRVNPVWAWIAVAVWMPFNVRQLRHDVRATLAADDRIFNFVDALANWSAAHPGTATLVYDQSPDGVFHHWGITAAWNLTHHAAGMPALWAGAPEAKRALTAGPVVWGSWDGSRLNLSIREPDSAK